MFRAEHPAVSRLRGLGLFSELDLGLAGLALRAGGPDADALVLAAALTSLRTAQRHVCLDLDAPLAGLGVGRRASGDLDAPPPGHWVEILGRSPAVGGPGDFTPFILEDRRLYLARYHQYEEEVAAGLLGLAGRVRSLPAPGKLRGALDRLFPAAGEGPDRQKLAAFAALRGSLCVITGGPGTGKTTTVARILALLLESAAEARPLRIGLAAPTGKAAARLSEAIRQAGERLAAEDRIKAAIPSTASTLHRLLGAQPDRVRCRYDRDNPLALDVVVVDEASMVDLPLMAKLLRAVPEDARLILLGDKDQLVSVEAGAVLGDICGTEPPEAFSAGFLSDVEEVFGDRQGLATLQDAPPGRLNDCVVELDRSYRFSEDSGIAALARAIRAGNPEAAGEALRSEARDLRWIDLPVQAAPAPTLRSFVLEKYADLSAADPGKALSALEASRILTPPRAGPWGVEALNAAVEALLRQEGMIQGPPPAHHGRPVMITRNDHLLRLFNGDTGIILHEARPWSFFRAPEGGTRRLPPARLPDHESVYAMTVHKSQGSEFEDVLLAVPPVAEDFLTRELLYTGVTRARKTLTLVTIGGLENGALLRRTRRVSGLAGKLGGR